MDRLEPFTLGPRGGDLGRQPLARRLVSRSPLDVRLQLLGPRDGLDPGGLQPLALLRGASTSVSIQTETAVHALVQLGDIQTRQFGSDGILWLVVYEFQWQ